MRIDFTKKFRLDCQHIKTWGWKCWTLFFTLVALISFFLYFYFEEWISLGGYRPEFYLGLLIVIILYFVIYQKMHPEYYIHIHHYNLVTMLMLFNGIHWFVSNGALGFLNGVFIQEVASGWYYHIWNPVKKQDLLENRGNRPLESEIDL